MNGWTIAAIVLLVLGLDLRSWIVFVALAVVLVVAFGLWAVDRYYVSHAGLDDLDEMSGWEFERWLERFFERVGFEVTRTPFRGDFGADFVLTWHGVRIAVQAKRNRRPVGLRAVQEVVAAKAHYGCEQAMVVTSGSFTEQALALAQANGVRMRTRDDLARKLVELDENDARNAIEPTQAARTMARARSVT